MENPFREYLEGDDVVTGVGLMRMESDGKPHLVAHILADYGSSEFYDRFFEKEWNQDLAFQGGFICRRLSDVLFRVETIAQFEASCEKDGETHVLKGPCFYIDCDSKKDDMDRFVEVATKNSTWLLHLMVGKYSYISALAWPDGQVLWRHKRDRVDVTMTGERSEL